MDVDVKAFVAMGLSPEINLANAFRVSVAEDLQSYGIEITDAAGQVHKFQIQPNDFTEMAAALAAAFEHWKTGVKECLK
ncbi:MAG: hypothetical protein KGO53_14200 [Alphaproteobacteria bacterium]|nr:hypothetical protein [Alphaproteobacteria bacterium]